jgi:hypothetical protein
MKPTVRSKVWMSIVLALFLAGSLGLHAGEIYGTLRESGRPVEKGVAIEITAPGGTKIGSGITDQFGSYRVFVKPKGKFTLIVRYQGKSLSPLTIYSYSNAVRYDLAIHGDQLRRK